VQKSPRPGSLDAILKRVQVLLKKAWLAKTGDSFVLAAGIPFGKSGGTNTVMVQKVA
jgi:pyruvate kinase